MQTGMKDRDCFTILAYIFTNSIQFYLQMTLSLILAMTENNVIGKGNKMPWHLPADMAYFKSHTTGHHIIMGRKTFESIGGKPLPNRVSIVVSRQDAYVASGCTMVRSLEQAIELCRNEQEVFVIGGMQIYEQALPVANRLYITRIHTELDGDAFFPGFDKSSWILSRTDFVGKNEKNAYDLTFELWERIG